MPGNLRPSPPASASAAANGLVTRSSPTPPTGALTSRAASLKTPRTNDDSSPLNGGLGTLVAVCIIGAVFLTLCVWATFYWRRRKRSRLEPGVRGVALGLSQNAFTYKELQEATDGFCSLNLLGQGGFGFVHKGLLPSGKVVAIKQLKAGSQQGEREFRAEVETISRVHHKHLVSLVGHCISGVLRILVYEYVPNGTLESHLHGKDGPTMAWPMRMKVAIGSARGLAYLHEECSPKIIHRDIKASNILLDYNFDAKVADFGLARFADTDTHVSTRVMGTFGYLDPEYAFCGRLTEKADVYSFGVVLVELVTGRKALDPNRPEGQQSLAQWARPFLDEHAIHELIDPRLGDQFLEGEVHRMLHAATLCIRRDPTSRPRMSQVVQILEGDMLGSHSRRIHDERDSDPLLDRRAFTRKLSLQTPNTIWWERDRARSRSYGDGL